MNHRFKVIALALSVMLSLTACHKTQLLQDGSSAVINAQTDKDKVSALPDKVQMFKVGVDSDYPPYDFFDEKGQATGFDVDILRAIGEKQNIQFDFTPTEWSDIVAGLENKQFKIALSGFAYSDERAEKYQVSNTYAYGQDIIVSVKKPNVKAPKTLEFLKNYTVITLGDSPYIEELESVMGKGSPNIKGVETSLQILQGLVDGEAKVALTDKMVAQYYKSSFPNVEFEFTGEGDYFEPYPLVMVAHKDEAELMQKINAGLAQIIKDGTYATIYKKWFGVEPEANFIPKM